MCLGHKCLPPSLMKTSSLHDPWLLSWLAQNIYSSVIKSNWQNPKKNSNFFFVKPSFRLIVMFLKDILTSLKVSIIPKVLMVTLVICICITTVQLYLRSHHKYNGIIPKHWTAWVLQINEIGDKDCEAFVEKNMTVVN